MIKITNRINGKLYKLVPQTYGCNGCVFKCKSNKHCSVASLFNGAFICSKLHGIWEEVEKEVENLIEIDDRKYKLVKGGSCSHCVFLDGIACSLLTKLNVSQDIIDACDFERSHWEEVKDAD